MVQITTKKEYTEGEWMRFFNTDRAYRYGELNIKTYSTQRYTKQVSTFASQCAPSIVATLLRLRAGYLSSTFVTIEAPKMKTNITTISPLITNNEEKPGFWEAKTVEEAQKLYQEHKDEPIGSIIRLQSNTKIDIKELSFVERSGKNNQQEWVRDSIWHSDGKIWLIFKSYQF